MKANSFAVLAQAQLNGKCKLRDVALKDLSIFSGRTNKAVSKRKTGQVTSVYKNLNFLI